MLQQSYHIIQLPRYPINSKSVCLSICLSVCLSQNMSTKEKLVTHVMEGEPVGSRNKVTVVGVGMVGMASAISILLKVRPIEWFALCP